MARLPQPGGDNGSWGDILNDYLAQAHNNDGNLSTNTVGAPQLKDNSVVETKLSSAVQTKLNANPDVADNSVSTVKLQDGSVTTVKLADDVVTAEKMAPGAVTKTDVGLTNVNDTSDLNKPISIATQSALDAKYDTTAATNALATKQNISTLASDVASHVNDGSTLDTTISAKIVANGGAAAVTAGVRSIPIPVAVGPLVSRPTVSSTASGTGRVPIYIARNTTDLILTYGNAFNINGTLADTEGASDLVMSASVEFGGTIYRAFFRGNKQVTITAGGTADSDPIPIDIPAGTVVFVRTFIASGTWYVDVSSALIGNGGWVATTDLTAPGSGAINDAAAQTVIPAPLDVRGRVTGADRRALISLGDSISQGSGDGLDSRPHWSTTNAHLGRGGWVGRVATANGIGITKIGTSSDSAFLFVSQANRLVRMKFAKDVTHAIESYGRNDISGSKTLAQVQTAVISIWTLLANRGIKVLRTTVTPNTSSTDGFTTLANQTQINAPAETVRAAFNAWLRDGAPIDVAGAPVATGTVDARRAMVYGPTGNLVSGASGTAHLISGVVDTAAAIEEGTTGKWKVPTIVRTTNDFVTVAANYTINSTTAGFTTADLGRWIIIAGAGASGGNFFGGISGRYSATSAGLAAPTPTAGSGLIGSIVEPITADGLHPGPWGHDIMAAAIPSTLLT